MFCTAMWCILLLPLLAGASDTTFRILLSSPKKPALTKLGDINNVYYTVPVQIGNQKFDLLLDTGSATIWVTSALCTTAACAKQAKYDRRASRTYRGTYHREFRLQYADNSMEVAVYSVDAVTVAGLTVQKQYFGEAAYGGSGDRIDGIFGMGPDSQVVSAGLLKPLTFLTNLQRNKLIDNRIFSLYITGGNDSVLTIGGVDDSFHKGKITYSPVVSEDSWTVAADTVSIGGNVLCNNCPAVVDSGTSAILIPSNYAYILQYLPGIRRYSNQFYVPCNQANRLPNFNFVISGVSFSLGPTDYVDYSAGYYYCRLWLVTKNLSQWILGDPFLRKYYTVFDADNNRVGFALSANRS